MSAAGQSYAALAALTFEDGILTWGGRKITELFDEVGHTPCYVYSRERMAARVAELRAAMPTRLRIHYAVKANPMREVVAQMSELVDGLDVASAGELELALGSSIDCQDVSFAGPGKRDFELAAALEAGVTVVLESPGEMRRLAGLAKSLGKATAVALRINPPFELARSGMKMGGHASPFGVDTEFVPAILKELTDLKLPFQGFHLYTGSQNLDAEAIGESLARTVDLVIEMSEHATHGVSWVNLGGGLGIPYFENERPLDLGALANHAAQAVSRLEEALGSVEVVMELGRYLVGEAGIYVCRVTDMKVSRGKRYAVVDGGMHHHLAASGNLGQVIRKNYPIVAVRQAKDSEEIAVVGPLCTPLDVLGENVTLDRVETGSLIGILQSGAYGRTASPEGFLSHPPCRELIV